jgi:myo-inositol-1(or 4)-monophosphatase
MTNDQWLEIFKEIGKKMREGLPEMLSRDGGKVPLGKGAGGDKTFPIDRWAEDIIINALERAHWAGELFTLISEELGVRTFGDGGKIVLVDPIDGSNNAKSGIPFFSTALALLDGDKLSDLAVAYVINLGVGEEFWAVRGQGAYKDGRTIRTSMTEALTILAYETSTPARDVPRIMPLISQAKRARCFGSTALDLAYLASGAISVFATAMASRTFDYAAGMLIVQEAGGVVTDLSGNTLDKVAAGIDRTVPLLASANVKLHALAVDLLARREE